MYTYMEHLRRNLSGGGCKVPSGHIYTIYTYICIHIHIPDTYRREIQRRIRWDELFGLPRPCSYIYLRKTSKVNVHVRLPCILSLWVVYNSNRKIPNHAAASAAGLVCHKRASESTQLTVARHSRGKRCLDRPATLALLPPSLASAIGAHHEASSQKPPERLTNKHTRGSDAGECRGAAATCLHQHSWRGCTWRSCTSQCPSAGTAVHPAPTRHI